VRVQSFERGEYLLADQRTGVRVSLCVDGLGIPLAPVLKFSKRIAVAGGAKALGASIFRTS
jgi:hypothetical protein